MQWFISNLLEIGYIGLAFLMVGFVRFGSRRLRKILFGLGLVFVISAVAGFGYIAISPPGLEGTVEVDRHPNPTPKPVRVLETLHLQWKSTEYPDWPVATLLAEVSEKAYLPPFQAKASYEEMGFDGFETFVDTSMVGYVISSDDATVIAFRGTDDIPDWFVNLNVSSDNTPYGKIHEGFYSAYRRLKSQIKDLLAQNKPQKIWITGHSLGGALALVCAFDLVTNEKQDVTGVITFGQPMVARRQLAQHLDIALAGRYVHYVNENDIVARVAPGYTHCGELVWLKDDGVERSKPKHLRVGLTGTETPPPEANEDSAPLSDMGFERMKVKLRKPTAGEGMKSRIVGAQRLEVTSVEEDDLSPLSDEQFRQVKVDLREQKEPPARSPDGKFIVKGSTPWLRDHSMKFYVEKINKYFGNAKSK